LRKREVRSVCLIGAEFSVWNDEKVLELVVVAQ
jgi:hypothetical protein